MRKLLSIVWALIIVVACKENTPEYNIVIIQFDTLGNTTEKQHTITSSNDREAFLKATELYWASKFINEKNARKYGTTLPVPKGFLLYKGDSKELVDLTEAEKEQIGMPIAKKYRDSLWKNLDTIQFYKREKIANIY